jgi:hypothetical protein
MYNDGISFMVRTDWPWDDYNSDYVVLSRL